MVKHEGMAELCSDCQELVNKTPEYFAAPPLIPGLSQAYHCDQCGTTHTSEPVEQPHVVYRCKDCGVHRWGYQGLEGLGIKRASGCSSKASFPTKEAAERELKFLNMIQYQCWCGASAPLADLTLEAYECSTLKKDWHIAPKSYPAEAHRTWMAETREIVRVNWGAMEPWEIARQVNRYLWGCCQANNGKTHHHASCTTPTGSGVIYQARDLGLIPDGPVEPLVKIAQKEARRILNRACEHGSQFKNCTVCYLGADIAHAKFS